MTDRSVVPALKEALSLSAIVKSVTNAAFALTQQDLNYVYGKDGLVARVHNYRAKSSLDQLSLLQQKLQSLLDNAIASSPPPSAPLEWGGLLHKKIEWEDSSSQWSGQMAQAAGWLPAPLTNQKSPSPSPTFPAPVVCRGSYDSRTEALVGEALYGLLRTSSLRCVCGRKDCQQ